MTFLRDLATTRVKVFDVKSLETVKDVGPMTVVLT